MSGNSLRYRIFLSVTDAESDYLQAVARGLWERSYSKDQLFVVGTDDVLRSMEMPEDIASRFTRVSVVAEDHPRAFLEICTRFQDRDFLFVKASILVPDCWDLRLALTASAGRGVATVSPFSDGGRPASHLASDGEPESAPPLTAPGLVDRICYETSTLDHLMTDNLFEDCVYVRSEALKDAGVWRQASGAQPDSAIETLSDTLRTLNYSHVLADHICVSSAARIRQPLAESADRHFERFAAALRILRYSESKHQVAWTPPSYAEALIPRHLHVMHNWGGGLERWVEEYCREDQTHQNFVLKSIGTPAAFGQELWLFRDVDDSVPIRKWQLSPPIKGTVASHPLYESIFSEIVSHYGIERILVSSLIGHSLDVLRSHPPTITICHDYYPFCPALNITFKTLCTTCTRESLTACTASNPYNRFFHNLSPGEWLDVREAFIERIKLAQIHMVAPARSVAASYSELAPQLTGHFRVVPHGAVPIAVQPLKINSTSQAFRVVILGRLTHAKGLRLFEDMKDSLTDFAEVFLVGCGVGAERFWNSKITAIPEYVRKDLPAILAEIQPNLGLLLSVVPETFSYTLQELLDMGIPTVATRVGSFRDRIDHGVNGFLVVPDASSILGCLRDLATDRQKLARVHETLCHSRSRAVSEMLQDYQALLLSDSPSAKTYFCDDTRRRSVETGNLSDEGESHNVLDRLLALAEADATEFEETMARTQADVRELRQVISSITNSRTWKATLPARAAVKFARRLGGFFAR